MAKSTKVLLLSPPINATGGIAQWAKNIIDYYYNLNDNSIKLSILPIIRSKFINANSFGFTRIFYGIIDYWQYIKQLKVSIKKENPSVVHITTSASFSLFKDLLIQRICKKYQIKNIIHFHFGRIPELYQKKDWEWKIIIKVINRSHKTIVLDDDSFNILINAGLKNIVLIPNPISPIILNFVEVNKHIKRIPRNILFAGHLIKTKGIYELVDVCSLIDDINLTMIGKIPNDETKLNLLSIAQRKGNSDWIHLKGNLTTEGVIKEMLSASIFVLPSYTEGFPNVILESMACGCSIIATTVGAIPEMLNMSDESEQCGICVEKQNINQLKIAIDTLLNNNELAETISTNAKKRVSEMYNMSIVWKQLVEIWK